MLIEAARKAADKEQPKNVAKINPRLYKFMVSASAGTDGPRHNTRLDAFKGFLRLSENL